MNIKTKLDLGDDGYFLRDNVVACEEVQEISIEVDRKSQRSYTPEVQITYGLRSGLVILEEKIFLTKEELLASL